MVFLNDPKVMARWIELLVKKKRTSIMDLQSVQESRESSIQIDSFRSLDTCLVFYHSWLGTSVLLSYNILNFQYHPYLHYFNKILPYDSYYFAWLIWLCSFICLTYGIFLPTHWFLLCWYGSWEGLHWKIYEGKFWSWTSQGYWWRY